MEKKVVGTCAVCGGPIYSFPVEIDGQKHWIAATCYRATDGAPVHEECDQQTQVSHD